MKTHQFFFMKKLINDITNLDCILLGLSISKKIYICIYSLRCKDCLFHLQCLTKNLPILM